MMKKHFAYILAVSTVTLILGGCSSFRDTLDLDKKAPNEFAVVKRAPLSLPPGYTLEPPRAGAPRPQEATPYQEAKTTIFGQEEKPSKPTSSATNLLLQQAGSNQTQNNIRALVDKESAEYRDDNAPVIDKILRFGSEPTSESVLDAQEELARLKKNKEDGKPLNTGETPVIDD